LRRRRAALCRRASRPGRAELARHHRPSRGLPHAALGVLGAADARLLADDLGEEGPVRRDPGAPARRCPHGITRGARRADPRATGARAAPVPGVLSVGPLRAAARAVNALRIALARWRSTTSRAGSP